MTKLILALLCLIAAPQVLARSPAPLVVLPLHEDGHIPVIDLLLNGKRVQFAMDTGAIYTIVDSSLAQRQKLPDLGATSLRGAGSGSAPAKRVGELSFRAGGLTFKLPDVIAVDLSQTGTGKPLDGLLGFEFFSRYVVAMNFDKGTLSLYAADGYAYPDTGAAIPLVLKPPRAFVKVSVAAQGVGAEEHELRLDSGSNDEVDDDIVLRSSGPKRNITGGVGLGSTFATLLGTVSELRIGPYVLHDLSSATGGVQLIGGGVLQRFNIVYDFSRSVMYLAPRTGAGK
jgi:Aspartyl protease